MRQDNAVFKVAFGSVARTPGGEALRSLFEWVRATRTTAIDYRSVFLRLFLCQIGHPSRPGHGKPYDYRPSNDGFVSHRSPLGILTRQAPANMKCMTEFTEPRAVNCPDCESARIVKIGTRNGYQRYLCRTCSKKFHTNGKAAGRRFPADQMGAAIRMFYSGMSYQQIAENMGTTYDIPEPSKATIYQWVRDYTKDALKEMEAPPVSHRRPLGGGRNAAWTRAGSSIGSGTSWTGAPATCWLPT